MSMLCHRFSNEQKVLCPEPPSLLFCKSVYTDNLMKLVSKGLVIMTNKLYPGSSSVAYGLYAEILDSPRFSPIWEGLEHFVQGEIAMLIWNSFLL